MSQSRRLKQHITQMEDIRGILNSMKNLAFIETHKLLRFQAVQDKVVESIEKAAVDFLSFYPYTLDTETKAPRIIILIGSERGFCGDFNDSLIDEMAAAIYTDVIIIGSRLANKWPDSYPEPVATLDGANVAEEVPAIVNGLLDAITSLQETRGFFELTAAYHDSALSRPTLQSLLPPFQHAVQNSPHFGFPPVLNLEPVDFFTDMVEHYLFAVLHKLCYASLMAENQRRLQHLDGAVLHLDNETVKLRRKFQIHRQEEITEEIEVILLNAENL
ncbi:F0F1 ATP synthase subunit gamma [Methylobacter sp. YRD-M1]|uniref:F0F1 ATP synthase subunit gamma n=1 Tax=Methylobacter sp. YRD-M1 TaxID=2911520 RepID=UPI00227C1459|nr:FoF1 ATP synthase subunit gamma [Methylobacter sp. YRD-M1]WAK02105.1 F0F1 ATP synthase subunit gamma [Methylobacter sp. YRD-M1]